MAKNTDLVGFIDCPFPGGCSEKAEVRKGKRRLVLDCPVHSSMIFQGTAAQNKLKELTEYIEPVSEKPATGAGLVVEPALGGEAEPAPEKRPEPEQEPARKKRKTWSIFK